ncbi:MAG: ATP-dependent sacrificial sulfur transferase LarE [Pirellulales bacterium]
MPDLVTKRDRLLLLMRGYGSCAVAFSAGVDSTVVAKAAQLALGESAVAITGTSASLAEGELDEARRLAEQIGIRHQVIATGELDSADYVRNAPDRCYHCKTELYTEMGRFASQLGVAVLVNGANVDDLGDYRPGMQAASEHRVESPLAECGITKQEVRQLAAEWELPVWDKPATPCLSSRIAYGQAVTPERLAMIDKAEQYLRELGLPVVRVRYHEGDVARLEVPPDALARLCSQEIREPLVKRFKELGFRFVSLDLEGFRSGSLNNLVPLDVLQRS